MELDEAIARRRMCRDFLDRPVDAAVVDRVIERAAGAPAAGGTQGTAWLVLEGAQQTGAFWSVDADPAWLAHPTHPGVLRAPVILVPLAGPHRYVERYRQADKAPMGRPGGRTQVPPDARPGERAPEVADWPVPWWLVDTSFAVMLVLLGATEERLGALLFALHGDPDVLLEHFGVPSTWQPLGALAIGWPSPEQARRPRPPAGSPGSSLAAATEGSGRLRGVPAVHRGRWKGPPNGAAPR